MAETEATTWVQRTARSLAELAVQMTEAEDVEEAIASALEAAGNIEAARFKVLLARCLEILRPIQEDEESLPDGLLEEIAEAIR